VTAKAFVAGVAVRASPDLGPPGSPRSIPRNLRAEGLSSEELGQGAQGVRGAQLCRAFCDAPLSLPTPIPSVLNGEGNH
jgi:hypothetical protein